MTTTYQKISSYAVSRGFNINRIEKAYKLAKKYHKGQTRKNGDPYIKHPINVAHSLLKYDIDENSIVSALIHDVIEDSEVTKSEISLLFGKDVATIIDLLSKKDFWYLSKMKSSIDEIVSSFENYPQATIVKMADRLHNLKTLHYLSIIKQKKKIEETRDVLIPAFYEIKSIFELGNFEDACNGLLNELIHEIEIITGKKHKYTTTQQIKHSIVKYDGYEGIKKAYEEVLSEAIRTNESILAYESGRDATIIGEDFFDVYIKKRVENSITAKVISPYMQEDKKYKEEYESIFTKVKLDPQLTLVSNINITGDLFMTFTINPPKATIIADPDHAKTMKNIFYDKWLSL